MLCSPSRIRQLDARLSKLQLGASITTHEKTTIPLLPRGVKYFGLVVSDGEEPWGLMQTLIVGR